MSQLEQELIAAVRALTEKVEKLEKNQKDRMEEDVDGEDGDEENQEEDPTWGKILKATAIEASGERAQFLCQVLSSPPPLENLRASEKSMPCYTKVPQTPPPRKNRLDSNLFNAQKKMELAMHMLVHHMEKNDKEAIGVGAAFVRSAWEDIHQQRRFLIAGRQSFKLDHRVDDTRPRLLSKEEEQKIGKKSKPKPRARPFWGDANSSSNAFPAPEQQHRNRSSTPRSKGKGKGGRGKGL